MQLPDSLVASLRGQAGFDESAFLAAHEQVAQVSIRLNPFKNALVPHSNNPVPWSEYGYYLSERPIFTLDPFFHAGSYYVQEASSMFVERVFRQYIQNNGLRVLDLCAAPGGKSTLISSLLSEDSLLVSNEVIRPRSGVLTDNMTKWGRVNSFVTNNDPKDFQRLPGFFDVIVIDAPCSGSGLFRKDPAALQEWSLDNVALCSQRQQRILADVWPSLKEDGILIYSTCSYSPQENEAILDWLSEEFEVTSLALDKSGNQVISEVQTEKGNCGYRFWPDKIQGEGFFIAAFRKKEAQPDFRYRTGKPSRQYKREALLFKPWVEEIESFDWVEKNGDYFLLQPEHRADFDAISQQLYLRKAGVRLGKAAGKDLIPDHELALSLVLDSAIPQLEVDREAALRYLKREDFEYDSTGKGWHLVTYEGHGLGWAKVLPNRLNNYLPKDWRILMDIREN
ncbi:MAG: rRNA methyltransferase [Siphonobacter sp.]